MWSNTKLLSIFSLVIVTLGFGLLFIGLKPATQITATPVPSVSSENKQTATNSASLGVEGEMANVLEVVDGDTIKVDIGGKGFTVRYIGMDTPETVDPRRPVGCFGKEASNENKGLVGGKQVLLQKDVSEKDKFGRLLRYVFLPLDNGKLLFVNDYLVREGFAKVLTYPPDVKFTQDFLEAQRTARQEKRGLWSSC